MNFRGTSDLERDESYGNTPLDQVDLKTFDPVKYYKLPADPWHITCRWKKEGT